MLRPSLLRTPGGFVTTPSRRLANCELAWDAGTGALQQPLRENEKNRPVREAYTSSSLPLNHCRNAAGEGTGRVRGKKHQDRLGLPAVASIVTFGMGTLERGSCLACQPAFFFLFSVHIEKKSSGCWWCGGPAYLTLLDNLKHGGARAPWRGVRSPRFHVIARNNLPVLGV